MIRRDFIKRACALAATGASLPLWLRLSTSDALAQTAGAGYKAVVLVTLAGGNDGNNMLVSLDDAEFAEYTLLRKAIALPRQSFLPVTDTTSGKTFGFHPSLSNTAKYFAQNKALVVANVGQLSTPITKAQILQNAALIPTGVGSHSMGRSAWESAQNQFTPDSGWGGRIADYLSSASGSLPPVLNAGPASIFTVGRSIQGISVQTQSASSLVVPQNLDAAVLQIAESQMSSQSALVAQVAKLHATAETQQQILDQAKLAGGNLKTVFPNTPFGQTLQTIASLLGGRSVIGASRQIFYCNQGEGNYDTHIDQVNQQGSCLAEFDAGIGAFFAALGELNLTDQVLVCTHSDFGRTMQSNTDMGSDHGWGNSQLLIGGGLRGGRIIGSLPSPSLGGDNDLSGLGMWIPSLSVTQMTASVGTWMGLNANQVSAAFPDLVNFKAGAISLMG